MSTIPGKAVRAGIPDDPDDETCSTCNQVHDGYRCCMCHDEDRPSWLEESLAEDRADCEASGGKIVHLTADSARQHVAELRADGSPGAYFYDCPSLLACDSEGGGCGREFTGTEHYHVASSPVPRRERTSHP